MIILLYGPPGAGKNTQGELLAKKLGLEFVSTGTELREEAKRNTPTANIMRDYLKRGAMLPATISGPFMLKKFRSFSTQKIGYITDGFPRQAATARQYLKYESPTVAIFLSLTDEILLERLLKRGRADDTKEIIVKRQKRYKKDVSKVRPMLEAAKVPTFSVDGTGNIETVAENIWQALKPLVD
jgi:adenylate kinase